MPLKRILIIDDEEDIRDVTSFSFEPDDFDVVTADGGVAGILSASEMQPDLILLDVMMPGMDGPETFARLQESEITRAIPVIFLTARVQPADRRRLIDLGARGIIAKPFDPMHLAGEVSTIAGW